MLSQFLDFLRSLNPFSGIDFSILWSWLPSDIGAVCAAWIILLCILALKRFIF